MATKFARQHDSSALQGTGASLQVSSNTSMHQQALVMPRYL